MRKVILVLVSILALASGASPAAASDVSPRVADRLPVVFAQRGSGEVRQMLDELAGTQSEHFMSVAMNSGRPVEVLMAPGSFTPLAVVEVHEPGASTYAITPIAPGCTTSDVCMRRQTNPLPSSVIHLGFAGTGSLTGSWTNIVYAYAGSKKTSFTSSAQQTAVVQPGVSLSWPYPGMHIVRIAR